MSSPTRRPRTEAVDYRGCWSTDSSQIDFYDSRRHLGALSGAALIEGVRRRAGADRTRLSPWRPGRDGGRQHRGIPRDPARRTAARRGSPVRSLRHPPRRAGNRRACNIFGPRSPSSLLRWCSLRTVAPRHTPAAVRATDLEDRAASFRTCRARHPPTSTTFSSPRFDVRPKAVVAHPRQRRHNIATVSRAMDTVRGSGGALQLRPMYHDMGLIPVLQALDHGGRIRADDTTGLRDPFSWMRNMTHHRSTVTLTPFAHRAADRCAGAGRNSADDVDLSEDCGTPTGAGADRRGDTPGFRGTLCAVGTSRRCAGSVYGMARVGAGHHDRRRTPAPEGLATSAASAPCRPTAWAPLVSCGPPIDGMRVRIVDSDGATRMGTVGEIQISGPSVMAKLPASDGSVISPPGGWHDTGDRGLICAGELFRCRQEQRDAHRARP